jgi:hypothetical protein
MVRTSCAPVDGELLGRSAVKELSYVGMGRSEMGKPGRATHAALIPPPGDNAMPATQKPQSETMDEPVAEDLVPPSPDEDGPHDVPDETVIEKTLPERPRGGKKEW